MLTSIKEELALVSSVPLANAAEAIAHVVMTMAGNDISTSINGNRMTRDMIAQIASQRIVGRLAAKLPPSIQNVSLRAKGI